MYATSYPVLVVVLTGLAGTSPRPGPDDVATEVAGVVSLDGKLLASGRVFIHTGGGQFVGSKVKDGKYKVSRVPAGKHTVTVEAEGLHARYTSEDHSGLSVVVDGKAGASFDLQLKSK
jgi:hypothetical protein